MALKESFVGLYVKRFVLPGALIFNKPGFVDFKISGKTNIYARQIFYPEDFFIRLEKRFIENFGDEGRRVLYSIGKRFGHRFAKAGKFENIKDHPGEKIKDWVFIASKFVEGTYASLVDSKIDVKNEKVDYFLKRWTVLENLGYDYIFAVGGAAGLISWLFQNDSIEGYLVNVEKKEDFYEANMTCAPFDYLKNNFPNELVLNETRFEDLEQDTVNYLRFNKQKEISNKNSFQTYLDFKFFNYNKGIVSFNSDRFFLFEASGTYLLEYDLAKHGSEEYLDILFNSAFDSGKLIMSKFGKNIADIFDVLAALGWGEVQLFDSSLKHPKIVINSFPWSKWYKEIDFLIIRGFLSGIFSAFYDNKILFSKPSIDLSKNSLTLLFDGKNV